MSSRLPPAFTSLYRLFLRTTSASVLHQTRATRHLRTIYRPTFEEAAKVLHQIQKTENSVERDALKSWMESWDHRMDNTLAMLYSSCKSRGLPHHLTRNLSWLLAYRNLRAKQLLPGPWSPTKQYSKGNPLINPKRFKREKQIAALDQKAISALRSVLEMAEGHSQLFLGRSGFRSRA